MALGTQMNMTILVILLALVESSTSLGYKSRQRNHTAESRQNAADVLIDAFDYNKCGDANFRLLQLHQNAFGCPARFINSSEATFKTELPFNGEPPNQGEFPFLVDIASLSINVTVTPNDGDWVDTREQYCTGVLIHKDIVLTTDAGCISGDVHMQFGRVGYLMGETRTRRRWCVSDGLVVILLDKPVQYVRNKIAPACLRRTSKQPSEKTFCSLPAYCGPKHYVPDRPYWDFNRRLSTRPMKRDDPCNVAKDCYRSLYGAGRCRDDSSSPVVCYDRCIENQPYRTQAYVVGLLTQKGQPIESDSKVHPLIGLLDKTELLMKLVRALRSGLHGVSCQNRIRNA